LKNKPAGTHRSPRTEGYSRQFGRRIGVSEAAAHGAPVSNRTVTDVVHRLCDKRSMRCDERGVFDIGVSC
jgi:hypothetical protein